MHFYILILRNKLLKQLIDKALINIALNKKEQR